MTTFLQLSAIGGQQSAQRFLLLKADRYGRIAISSWVF
jgi:hypothetical protein